jgi:hypothetical protein
VDTVLSFLAAGQLHTPVVNVKVVLQTAHTSVKSHWPQYELLQLTHWFEMRLNVVPVAQVQENEAESVKVRRQVKHCVIVLHVWQLVTRHISQTAPIIE